MNDALPKIDEILIDGDAIAYATFQSHNQKVISNDRGIFTTHIRTSDPGYNAQQWWLMQSTDGGKTFSTVYDTTEGTSAPAIETDSKNNIYLIRPDFHTGSRKYAPEGSAYFERFLNGADISSPLRTDIPYGSGGKYTTVIDEERGKIYYWANNNRFHIIGTDGKLQKTYLILEKGPKGALMYPLLTVADDGTLYAAWYTQQHDKYVYRSIHAMVSRDEGHSWQKFDGTPLTLPIVDDETGPADMISQDDSLDIHSILNSFMVKDNKLHFACFEDKTPHQTHYVRYDTQTMQRDIESQPFFREHSGTRMNNSGFFISRRSVTGSTIFYVSGDCQSLLCYASDDNGATWYEYAAGDKVYPISDLGWHGLYAIGGPRELTEDGHIIGTYTEVADFAKSYYEPHSGKVHFFKIQAGLCRVNVTSLNYEDEKLTINFDDVRGQPEKIRFKVRNNDWTSWQEFSETMGVSLPDRPSQYQLQSRLGVVGQAIAL